MSNTESQNNRVLRWLKAGRTITSWLAFNYWQMTRLSARIYDLRQLGHKIKSRRVKKGAAYVAEYSL